MLDDRPGQDDAETAADADDRRDERDPLRDAVARELVADDREGEREDRAARTLDDPAEAITGIVVATAATAVPAASVKRTTTSTRFLPNMSPSRPAIGVMTDALSR